VGSGAEKLLMQSTIEALAANKERLFIFTEKNIEVITAQSLLSVGTTTATYSTPISGENRAACHRSVVVADDLTFFLTRKNQIKTIGFMPGKTEAVVGPLSNREGMNIQSFLNTLDTDQSNSFGYYHKEKQLVKRYLRESGETMNNICLVYDIANDNFYIDDNQYYSCSVEHEDEYYCGNDATPFIYIDETGSDDDG
jgi:hypothetical protein